MEDVGVLAEANMEGIIDHIDQLSVNLLVDSVVQSNLKYINQNPREANADNPYYKNTDAIKDQIRSNVFTADGVVAIQIYSLEGVEMTVGTISREMALDALTEEEIYAANGVIAGSSDEAAVGSAFSDYRNTSGNYYHDGGTLSDGWSIVMSMSRAKVRAEIEYLKMQITPHFLYNTLDTISWLGFTNGCEEITNLAVALADLLRSSIKNDDIIMVR